MVERIKLGVVGISDGNGHPYSFSSIINGYDPKAMKASDWPGIYAYLNQRKSNEFGFPHVQVTHAWTQDARQTKALAAATRIPHAVRSLDELIDQTDGILLARDDFERHFDMAQSMLKQGKFVFIDKPLSLDLQQLRFFRPYLEKGTLMSCSGLAYARELDKLRDEPDEWKNATLIRGAVINGMEKYGIHILDGVLAAVPFCAMRVLSLPAQHDAIAVESRTGALLQVDALGPTEKTFQFDFWSKKRRFHAEVTDNFTMFRRMLAAFIGMMRTGSPPFPPERVMEAMKILIAARLSKKQNRWVDMDEIKV